MAITEQHFAQLSTDNRSHAPRRSLLMPTLVTMSSWLAALSSVSLLDGPAAWLLGGAALFALPALWLHHEVKRQD